MKRSNVSGLGLLSIFAVLLVFALYLPQGVVASDTTGQGEEAVVHGEGGGEDHGGGAIPAEKLWGLLWRTTNFIALVVVLFFLLRKPVGNFFRGRREDIARTLSDLELKKAEAEESYLKLERKLIELEKERENILADYIKDGEAEKEKIISNAKAMEESIMAQSRKSIDQEIEKAKNELKAEIAELSASMAEELVKNNINEQDQERLVEEYLDKVVQN